MHARQATFRIDGCEPSVEEHPSPMWALGAHQREGSTRIVEYRIDEHLKIRQLKRLRFRIVEVFECSGYNGLELLSLGT